ncbi:MAG: hypothetical protein JW797_20290 [Bradymonadales bacterium]|nr:hypothetical protein [Bradymonadales bacterium]
MGDTSADIPTGALSETIEIGIAQTTTDVPLPSGYELRGEVFAFTPHGTTFAQPVTITLPYSGSSDGLVVLHLDDDSDTSWEILTTATFGGGIATLQVDSFSLMGVAGPPTAADPDLDAGDLPVDSIIDTAELPGDAEMGEDPPPSDQVTDETTFRLTIEQEGLGAVILDPSGFHYPPGTVVQLRANPDVNYRFDRWEGDLTGMANPATILMDSDKTVRAVFIIEQLMDFEFYATYDRIIDLENQGLNLYNGYVDMSTDGSMLAGVGFGGGTRAFTIDALGQTLLTCLFENVVGGSYAATISPDGTRAYVSDRAIYESHMIPVIYKMVGETCTRLELREAFEEGFNEINVMHTNADGSDVFFRDGGKHHIWHINQNGLDFVEVIDPGDYVESDESRGMWIGDFDVNDGGGHFVFEMTRWVPPPGTGTFDDQDDILTWRSTTQFTRLTADTDPEIGKSNVLISPDGSSILFVAFGENKTYVSDFAGSSIQAIDNFPGTGSVAASGDMQWLFWANTTFGDSGGLLASRNGVVRRQLFAGTTLNANGSLNMSIDGRRIAFRHHYASSPHRHALYYGWLYITDDLTDAPDIEWVRMSPPEMPRDDSEAYVVITVEIADDDGLETINRVEQDVLDGGDYFASGEDPVSVSALRDDGQGRDLVADDGIYTAVCTPTSKMATYTDDEVTVRIALQDTAGNAVVADVVLSITP